MLTGTGRLNLRDGRRINVLYQFAGDYDDRRAGYLLFDTRECDDSQFCHRLVLECEDGASVVLVVMNRSDRHLAVHGRELPVAA